MSHERGEPPVFDLHPERRYAEGTLRDKLFGHARLRAPHRATRHLQVDADAEVRDPRHGLSE